MAADALLINADDLGLWPSVNTGIVEAWAQRAIGDSSVLANAPDLDGVLSAARAAGMPVGVHLNLTLGTPLSNPEEIPTLVTPQGQFMKRQHWSTPLPGEQVRLELRRQVERVLATGWQPSHLDSHHHVHRYPEILPIVIELAQEYQLPLRAVDTAMRDELRVGGLRTPDHFTMTFYGEKATVATLIALTDECPGGVLEIMTHPGYVTPDLPSSYREDRAREFAALTAPQWCDYLQEHGIDIIGFQSL